MRLQLFVVGALVSLVSLNGCGPAVLGGAAGVAVVASRDEPVEQQVRDGTIWVSIYRAFKGSAVESLSDIDVSVTSGRVTLSGHVCCSKSRAMAGKLASEVQGVVSVDNQIRVVKGGESLGNSLESFALSARVRTNIVLAIGLRASNYKIDADLGIVTISGNALDAAECDQVLKIARGVRGVVKVNSNIVVASR